VIRRFQQGVDLAPQDGQLGLYDVPHQPIVDVGVPVNQEVAERNDAPVIRDAGRDRGIELASCASASPMISNSRSTAARNIASFW
jgi:hypothetical protein